MSANEIAVDDGKSNETQVMEEKKTSADWIFLRHASKIGHSIHCDGGFLLQVREVSQ